MAPPEPEASWFRATPAPFRFPPRSDILATMKPSENMAAALSKAQNEGVDLTLLRERLSWTPSERLKRNYEAAESFEELKKAGQHHRAGDQRREAS